MGWDLTADLYIGKSGSIEKMINSFLEFFNHDTNSITIKVSSWQWQAPIIFEERLENFNSAKTSLLSCADKYLKDDLVISCEIELSLAKEGDSFPRPSLDLFSPQSDFRRNTRDVDAVIGFGNHTAYNGTNRLKNGRILSKEVVIENLINLCEKSNPESLFLHCEETVSFPLDYHFVYHNDLQGFKNDIQTVIDICLKGGINMKGSSKSYPPALSDKNGETMLFAKRSGIWLEKLKSFLSAKIERIETKGIPKNISRNFIEEILLDCEDLDFFFTEQGLGVWALPLLDNYCENPYITIMERWADQNE